MDRPTDLRVLEEFSSALCREAHNLTQRPDLLWQQMYNRLQWADGPDKDGAMTCVLAPELEERGKPGHGPWLHLLRRLHESERLPRAFARNPDGVRALAYSPDGNRVASGSDDATVKIWDAGGTLLATLTGHTAGVNVVAYSPDGNRIASGSDDKTIKIWDVSAGRKLANIKAHKYCVNALAYSPDGTRIVSGSGTYPEHEVREQDNALRIWDADSGKGIATLTGHRNVVRAVAYSPDGTRIASGSDDWTVRVWDAANGAELAAFLGHKDAVRAVAYSPDGGHILSGSGDGSLKVWDSDTFTESSTFGHAPDGVELATATGHAGPVNAVAYSPDGTRILSGSADNTVRLWDARKMECIALLPCLGSVEGCDYGPRGRLCCGDASGIVHILELLGSIAGPVTAPFADAEIGRFGAYSHLDAERAAHSAFAAERADGFTGRARYLDAIGRYLDGRADHPLCVVGAGGLGKSTIMSRASADAVQTHPDAVIVTRFIGVTLASAEPRSLLQDLCTEIGEAYGSKEPVPSALEDLQLEFPRRLGLASTNRPLIVFLDGPDQLVGSTGMNLSWLPSNLPDGVRLVIATGPGAFLDQFAGLLPDKLVMELDAMPPDEGQTLLNSWLRTSGRTLTPGQRNEILRGFGASGSPLYLRLAFEEARLWSSALKDVRIGDDEVSIIGGLYDRLETEHGAELVGHALGFLACTYDRLGLSEDELLDALTADEQTWAEVTADAYREMPLRRLPTAAWSRLYFDLAPYLSPRVSEGASLLSFSHKELANVAQHRYLEGRSAHLHGVLADVMGGLARGRHAGPRQWKGSAHALAELPYHLIKAERWDDLFATLTDFTYLQEKAKRVGVKTTAGAAGEGESVYNGVRMLIDDFAAALAAFGESGVVASGREGTRRDGDWRDPLAPASLQTFLFSGADLGSKYGFDDGDVLNELVEGIERAGGPGVDPHTVLAETLRRYLFPRIQACPGRLPKVALWLTAHNPVRFVDDQGHDLLRASSGDVAFDDVDVTVSADEIRKVTKDLHDAGLSHFAAYQDSFAALYPSAASTSWAPPSGTASGGA